MEIFFTIILLTLIVSLSGVRTQLMQFQIPLPLMQIVLGALLAWPPFWLHVDLNPERFMVLFIPPLFFYYCWNTQKSIRNCSEIVVLALVLVMIWGLVTYLIPGIANRCSSTIWYPW